MNKQMKPRPAMANPLAASAPIMAGAACAIAMFAALMLGNPEALENAPSAPVASQAMAVAVEAWTAPQAPAVREECAARPYIRGIAISVESQADHFDASERRASASR